MMNAQQINTRATKQRTTVLLVEDAPNLRQALRAALASSGYMVLDAGDGYEALKRAEQCRTGIDVLLTDIEMPRMSGLELSKQLQARIPGLPTLLMSGSRAHPLSLLMSSNFIPKPFRVTDVVQRVNALCNRDAEAQEAAA